MLPFNYIINLFLNYNNIYFKSKIFNIPKLVILGID